MWEEIKVKKIIEVIHRVFLMTIIPHQSLEIRRSFRSVLGIAKFVDLSG